MDRDRALDLGMPVTLIGEAVFARCLSALKPSVSRPLNFIHTVHPYSKGTRKHLSTISPGPLCFQNHQLRARLYADARRCRRDEVEAQLRRDCADVARRLHHPQPVPQRHQKSLRSQQPDRELAARPLLQARNSARRIWLPHCRRLRGPVGNSDAVPQHRLIFFYGYRTARLPANLLQAQRDFFGAHTYERVDAARGTFFHTNWTGTGGNISSSTYSV